jgi:hypothetical protein
MSSFEHFVIIFPADTDSYVIFTAMHYDFMITAELYKKTDFDQLVIQMLA